MALVYSVADPDPGSGMCKMSGSGSGTRIRDEQPDHISESLETIFWVTKCGSGIWNERNSDPGWKKFGSGIRDKHPGSATATLLIY